MWNIFSKMLQQNKHWTRQTLKKFNRTIAFCVTQSRPSNCLQKKWPLPEVWTGRYVRAVCHNAVMELLINFCFARYKAANLISILFSNGMDQSSITIFCTFIDFCKIQNRLVMITECLCQCKRRSSFDHCTTVFMSFKWLESRLGENETARR